MMNPQMRQQMMQQFDANGNGQLDPNEQQALQQFMQSRGMGMGGRPGGPGGPGGGKPGGGGGPGGGMMSPEMRQQMLQKFDTNGNGQLDPEERQAAQQFMQSRGMGMGGPPGAGGKGNGPKTGKVQPAATTKGKPDAASAAQDKQIQLLRFDKNGNGKLEPDELKAAREAAKE
jgi:Ca2+-binding EF-hand superfamily protein